MEAFWATQMDKQRYNKIDDEKNPNEELLDDLI
jgi:hypothetical protein